MRKFFLVLISSFLPVSAEWKTEDFSLRAGWNAIYPFVDSSHLDLNQLLADEPGIIEVWRWQPERVDGRRLDPSIPPISGGEWGVWRRADADLSSISKLLPNFGYLVKVADTSPALTFTVKGRAVLPEVRWREDGLNLIGFPVTEAASRPTFSQYLQSSEIALTTAKVLQYRGGPLADGVNPRRVNLSGSRLERGKAYWFNTTKFSRFQGDLKITLGEGNGPNFGPTGGSQYLQLQNLSDSDLAVEISRQTSLAPPAGQPAIAGSAAVTLRPSDQTIPVALSSPQSVTIPGKTTLMVEIGLDRPAMGGDPGDYFSAIINFATDSQSIDLPFTAEVNRFSGLWVGEAQMSQVGSILKRYRRYEAADGFKPVFYGIPFTDIDGVEEVVEVIPGNPATASGQPVLVEDLTTPQSIDSLPAAARAYPLRLIVHVDDSGTARILSHAYSGVLANTVDGEEVAGLTMDLAALDQSRLEEARRVSVAHLPLDTNQSLGSDFLPGGQLGGIITISHLATDNPFVHAYHPDHDNLDARFKNTLPDGAESFEISRLMTFNFDSAAPASVGKLWGTGFLTGTMTEDIDGLYKETLRTRGAFALRKISDISLLSNQPN